MASRFLTESAMVNEYDALKSASSQIVLGRVNLSLFFMKLISFCSHQIWDLVCLKFITSCWLIKEQDQMMMEWKKKLKIYLGYFIDVYTHLSIIC